MREAKPLKASRDARRKAIVEAVKSRVPGWQQWTSPEGLPRLTLEQWEELLMEPLKFCGANAWPYTESNVCIREPHKDGYHRDKLGRDFDHGGYLKKSSANSGLPVVNTQRQSENLTAALITQANEWRKRGWPGSHYDEDNDCPCPDHVAMRAED